MVWLFSVFSLFIYCLLSENIGVPNLFYLFIEVSLKFVLYDWFKVLAFDLITITAFGLSYMIFFGVLFDESAEFTVLVELVLFIFITFSYCVGLDILLWMFNVFSIFILPVGGKYFCSFSFDIIFFSLSLESLLTLFLIMGLISYFLFLSLLGYSATFSSISSSTDSRMLEKWTFFDMS